MGSHVPGDSAVAETDLTRAHAMSPIGTAVFFLLGNVLPSLGLLLMLRGTPMPASWQSGEFHDYVTFLLSARAAALFYPFFFYSIACFTLGLLQPKVASSRFWVRFGIYSGIPLALQYCFVVGVVVMQVDQIWTWRGFLLVLAIPLTGLALVGIPLVGWWFLGVMRRYLEHKGGQVLWVSFLMFASPVLALLLGLVPGGGGADEWFFAAVVFPGLAAVVAAPVWMVAVFAALARRIYRMEKRRFQLPLLEMLGVFSWLAAYMAAWRFAIVQTLEAYAALPASQPSGCYIATAAARGHPRFVGSWSVRFADGELRRVNMQLAHLKCGELALRTTFPRLHGRLRYLYDAIGPLLANAIIHPVAADFAYIFLKPAEWVARIAIACTVPQAAAVAKELYPQAD